MLPEHTAPSAEPSVFPKESRSARFPSDRFDVPSEDDIMSCLRPNKDHLDHRLRETKQV